MPSLRLPLLVWLCLAAAFAAVHDPKPTISAEQNALIEKWKALAWRLDRPRLLAVGSGSTPNRRLGALIGLDANGRPVVGAACTGCGACINGCVTSPSSITARPWENR